MKFCHSPSLLSVWMFVATCGTAAGDTLRCTGVLGNSGEQGSSLARFAQTSAPGMGVVYDKTGSLWDRGGDGQLNRYAADGRLLATYPLPSSTSESAKDTLTLLEDTLLLKVGQSLLTLPVDAGPGHPPASLAKKADRLSFSTFEGWAAASFQDEIFLVNAHGETRTVGRSPTKPEDLEIGPDGGVYGKFGKDLIRLDSAASPAERAPRPAPGDRPQWLAGRWYGFAWHGTIRRFHAGLAPDPGVVLGGASGSFIGYVEGNHELSSSRGLAHLGGRLYATSGIAGVLHLMEWRPEEQRFKIVRRIGAAPECSALALDSKGRVWFHCGVWDWSDGPDAPLRHSVPPPESPGLAGAVRLENDAMAAPGVRWGKNVLYGGTLDGPAAISDASELPKNAAASAIVRIQGRAALLVVDARGTGHAFFVGADGKSQGSAGPVALRPAQPLVRLTSLAAGSHPANTLLAAADGCVIRFAPQDGQWREVNRWQSWGPQAEDRFGAEVRIASDAGRLWVSDTLNHRILCFDEVSRKLLATHNAARKAGNTFASLDRPTTLAAHRNRAVVFDSGNQRVIKLEWLAD